MTAARAIYWVFTENDNPEALVSTLELEGLPDGISYLCGQLEIGTCLHFQGYVELEARQRIPWLKKNLSPTAHFEKRMGSQEEAIAYCCKLDDTTIADSFVEFGEKSNEKKGKRNDLLEAKALIEDGADDLQVADECFRSWCQHSRSFEVYRAKLITAGRLEPPPPRGPVTTWVLWGPPGSGKTTMARQQAGVGPEGGPSLFEKAPQSDWWTGYEGQDAILLDEHNSGWLKWDTLMALLNPIGGPLSLPIHCGMVSMRATKVFITCNVPPEDWYRNVSQHKLPALWRRINTGGVYQVDPGHTSTLLDDYNRFPSQPIPFNGNRWN